MKMQIIIMKNGQKEVNKKKKPSILTMALFLALLDQPNYSGFNWKQYIEATIQYNAQQIYKQVILNTQQQKEKVHKQFLNNEFDVLITNITTGKDLPCDYVIFYELTFDYKQMIGRGERGLDGVDLDVLFIITDSVYEMRFFYANVYQRGILLEKLCGKDLPELHGAVEQLEHKLEEKGISIKDLFEQDD